MLKTKTDSCATSKTTKILWSPSSPAALALLILLLIATGCGINPNVNHRNQPRYDTYDASEFWPNGTSAREMPKNTVARGFLKTNTAFWEGREAAGPATTSGQSGQGAAQGTPGAQGTTAQVTPSAQGTAPTSAGAQTTPAPPRATSVGPGGVTGQGTPGAAAAAQSTSGAAAQAAAQGGGGAPQFVDTFPFPVTEEVMRRGQERFNIFCTPCHGFTGEGDGLTTRVGMKQPASFHIERLRTAPVGYYYDVITNGFGVMPNYGDQIYVNDRWAIVAYIRALQLSQNVKVDDLTPEQRNQLNAGGQ